MTKHHGFFFPTTTASNPELMIWKHLLWTESYIVKQIIFRFYEWVIKHVSSDGLLYDWVSSALYILRGVEPGWAVLTSSSISVASLRPHQMPAPLYKVEEGRCHSLNRIYGLLLRHKLDSKHITVDAASSSATCLCCCCARINTARLIKHFACLPTKNRELDWNSAIFVSFTCF